SEALAPPSTVSVRCGEVRSTFQLSTPGNSFKTGVTFSMQPVHLMFVLNFFSIVFSFIQLTTNIHQTIRLRLTQSLGFLIGFTRKRDQHPNLNFIQGFAGSNCIAVLLEFSR